jgi:DNA-binding SARP family transcriptional activator
MARIPIDTSIPLDWEGVVMREDKYGNTEAVCPHCNSWIRIHPTDYKGGRTLMRAIPHNYPCDALENYLKDWKVKNAPMFAAERLKDANDPIRKKMFDNP